MAVGLVVLVWLLVGRIVGLVEMEAKADRLGIVWGNFKGAAKCKMDNLSNLIRKCLVIRDQVNRW